MDNENTTFDKKFMDNDATQLDNSLANQQTGEKTTKASRPKWVNIAGSAGAGLLLGAGYSVLTSSAQAAEAETPSEAQTESGAAIIGDGSLSVASGVSDDMSFGEAFAAARQEVGPGGVFEWHGHAYGTYYESEWNSMTQEQRDDYFSHVSNTPVADRPTHDNTHVETETTNTETTGQETTGQGATGQGATETTTETTGNTTGNITQTNDNGTVSAAEVEVLGVYHDEESNANIVGMTVDGHDSILVDVDNDNTIDIMAIDINDNAQLEPYEIVDISEQGVTVDQLVEMAPPMGADISPVGDVLPDYTNDINTDGCNV